TTNEDQSLMQQIVTEDLMKFGIIPEFIGRIPITAALEKLTEDDLVHILTEPKNALVKQYSKLMALDNVELEFTPEALHAIAHLAIERNTGARGLRSIIEEVMMDMMFDIPSREDVAKVVVTKEAVDGAANPQLFLADGQEAS
ncbi:MAG: ATP-dependent Clp protease ATP-binding subunit ClpX, partial [Latilactobacillus curvatus]|nr:ATP-dependent Clp protease ATP-binding subunit ClpX [Latilactobacillus curvatus]